MTRGDRQVPSRRRFLNFMAGCLGACPSLLVSPRQRSFPRQLSGWSERRTQGDRRPAGPVTFTDVTAPAGLARAVNVSGSKEDKRFILEEMGGGAAFFDYDNDGWLDIFLVNGTSFDPAARDARPTSYLFHNNRDGTFTDVTKRAGLTQSGWGQGCCVGDYDNDGFDDLFVSYWGRNVLYHNNGDGTFTDVSEKAGVAGSGSRWGAGCCFLDYDRDGRLDLFVANYLHFDPAGAPIPGDSAYCRYNEIPVPCGPLGFAGGTNILYRNRGDGTFADVSEQSGIARPRGPSAMVFVKSDWRPVGSYGMGAAAADFDNDGWPDIYVASDTAPSLLYRNNHDGTFREIGVPSGSAFDEHGVALAGMGVGVGDYDADGWLDIVRTNFSEQLTILYRNYGGGFEDASIRAGLGVNRKYVGFGVDFFDFDNDGWTDIFIANGHVYSQIAGRKLHLSYRQPRLLYRNLGNSRFEDVSALAGPAVTAENLGRGCAFGDFDNDGDLDVLINNLDGPPTLLRNDGGNRNNSIMIKCIGTRSNRSAIGTRVKVTAGGRAQIDEVTSGSSYYSQNDFRLHFGLGSLSKADTIEFAWPSGVTETVRNVPANQLHVCHEGKGIVTSRKFRQS
jgi:enediyne biosynthesis protein E4